MHTNSRSFMMSGTILGVSASQKTAILQTKEGQPLLSSRGKHCRVITQGGNIRFSHDGQNETFITGEKVILLAREGNGEVFEVICWATREEWDSEKNKLNVFFRVLDVKENLIAFGTVFDLLNHEKAINSTPNCKWEIRDPQKKVFRSAEEDEIPKLEDYKEYRPSPSHQKKPSLATIGEQFGGQFEKVIVKSSVPVSKPAVVKGNEIVKYRLREADEKGDPVGTPITMGTIETLRRKTEENSINWPMSPYWDKQTGGKGPFEKCDDPLGSLATDKT